MSEINCDKIRSQVMYFIDNEMTEEVKSELMSHLDGCEDCQNYYDHEKEIKSKICEKIKDSYICKCNVTLDKLKSSVQSKINELIKS